MRLRNVAAFSIGAGAIVALALLMAATGGFPSRPRFHSVGVGATADSTSGSITGSGTDGLLLRTPAWSSILLDSSGVIYELHNATARISVNRGDGDFIVPTRLVATTAKSGAALMPGDSIVFSKSADTSRTSTITTTADPDLQVTGLPAGHYQVEAWLYFTDGAGGHRSRLDHSGADNIRMQGVRQCTTGGSTAVAQDESFDLVCAGAGTGHVLLGGGTEKPTAGGTIAVFWAQNTSNAAATTLESFSWLKVTRLN